MTPLAVSEQAARRFILGCQGLWPGRRWAGRPGVRKALHQSGLVQIDPLNVVGRSHDLALHARVWDYSPAHLDHLMYTSREFFDYGGTLYVLPMSELPYWRVHMARRAAEEKSRAFAAEHKQLLDVLREDVSSRGPVASRDYAGRASQGTFRSGKDTARALRHLWLTGELMTHGRRGFERLYALRNDVAPVEVQHAATEDEADGLFARKALALLGLATAREWAQRFRHLARRRSDPHGERRRLEELLSSGVAAHAQIGDGPAHYLLGERAKQLETVQRGSIPRAWRTPRADTLTEATFLPPLEFVTARGRAAKWFDFDYIWEAYKPAAKRRWGYYVMPILHGDRLVGRADLRVDRDTRTLIVPHLWLEHSTGTRDADLVQAIGRGLHRLAEWAGGDHVHINATSPTRLRAPLTWSKPRNPLMPFLIWLEGRGLLGGGRLALPPKGPRPALCEGGCLVSCASATRRPRRGGNSHGANRATSLAIRRFLRRGRACPVPSWHFDGLGTGRDKPVPYGPSTRSKVVPPVAARDSRRLD